MFFLYLTFWGITQAQKSSLSQKSCKRLLSAAAMGDFYFEHGNFELYQVLSPSSPLRVLLICGNHFTNAMKTPNNLFNKSIFPTATQQ